MTYNNNYSLSRDNVSVELDLPCCSRRAQNTADEDSGVEYE